jgi:U3 small nucleolar RNA-associated protein 19
MPVASSLPPTKKRKTAHVANIERLEETLTVALSKSASLNPLVDLINLATTLTDAQDLHKAIYALYRIFVLIINSGRLCGGQEEGEEAKVVRSWLNERLAEYTTVLCTCLRHSEKGIMVCNKLHYFESH